MRLSRALSFLALAGAFCASGWADLIGTSVTGNLKLGASSVNFFDPAVGFVPAGYLNTSGTTVTISAAATEFGFSDPVNTDTANFTGSQLTITDVSDGGQINTVFSFTDSAFAGLTLAELSDTFPAGGANATLVGNTLTINTPRYLTTGTFSAVYNLAPSTVPEPGSIGLLLTAMCGVAWPLRKKLRRS